MNLTRFFLSIVGISNLIFPNISIAGVDLSQKNVTEATLLLFQNVTPPEKIVLIYQNTEFVLETKDIDLKYNYQASVQRVQSIVNTGNIFQDLHTRIDITKKPRDFGLIAEYDIEKLNKFISVVDGQITNDPVYPQVSISGNNIEISEGVKGIVVDKEKLYESLTQNIAFANESDIEIQVKEIDPKLTDDQILKTKEIANKLIGKKLEIKFEYQIFTKNDKEIVKFIDPLNGFDEEEIKNFVNEIVRKTNREPQDPKFEFTNNKVTEFQPALDGVTVNQKELIYLIENGIKNANLSFDLPVTKTSPKISTDKVNNLGIKELIGRGTSTYFHSIPGRVHNVSLAASKINGTLVAPNETFSFNQTLGDVSKFTGYQSAYVILSGKTVLGDGGGVCQVSSTLFRAILDAGLPIDQRTAHAYRVGYYEQGSPPGFDATVYSPSPDFKFTNNTPNHVLITAKADSKNYSLVFEIYGTSDGRSATVSKPVISSQSAPGPDIYQDDPTLPIGTVKQVEYRAYGAKVSFNYLVTRNGEEIYKKTFVSNYKPWAAVYLRGTMVK